MRQSQVDGHTDTHSQVARNQQTPGKVARTSSPEAQNMQDDFGSEEKVRSSQKHFQKVGKGGKLPEKWSGKQANMAKLGKLEQQSLVSSSDVACFSLHGKQQFPSVIAWELSAETYKRKYLAGGRNLKANRSEMLTWVIIIWRAC